MTTAEAAAAPLTGVGVPTELATGTRARIFAYAGVLIILLYFGSPHSGFIDTPITFFLKNRLHLPASQVAVFRLLAAAPLYLGGLFGFVRDTFNPLGLRDRGFFIVFGAATTLVYVVFAFAPMSYAMLLAAVLLGNIVYQFVSAALNGLSATLGQQHVMSGRLAAFWNIFLSLPNLAAFYLGGVLSGVLEGQKADLAARILFLIGGTIMAIVALYGLWRPKVVYDNLHGERPKNASRRGDFVRLIRHWPIYPALLIWLLWCFAPGAQTPLQYFLTNTLHASDAQWGAWNALFAAGFIPTFLLFGWLCRRVPLRTLLFWGTVAAVPQMIPLAFIHTVTASLIAAVVMGLLGGVATAAYTDLVIRSCPKGLQGAVMMIYWALYWIAARFGDILGADLYDRFHDFNACVIAITVVYAAILPALWLVPRELVATPDGEAPG